MCINILIDHGDRVEHFLRRMDERGDDPQQVVINFVKVDAAPQLVEMLMPGQEALWQSIRDKGEVPYARGLATRPGYQEILDAVYPEAGNKLRSVPGKAVIVVDHGAVEVFDFS